MQKPEVQTQHSWLQKLVGNWTWESEGKMESGELVTFGGTELVRSLGGLWIVCEGGGNTPGGETHESIMTLGFDPAKESFVGTFVSGMMTHLWIYERGSMATENRLDLYAEGPGFGPDAGMVSYRDSIELHGENERTLTSHMKGADGSWTQFMESRYRRVV